MEEFKSCLWGHWSINNILYTHTTYNIRLVVACGIVHDVLTPRRCLQKKGEGKKNLTMRARSRKKEEFFSGQSSFHFQAVFWQRLQQCHDEQLNWRSSVGLGSHGRRHGLWQAGRKWLPHGQDVQFLVWSSDACLGLFRIDLQHNQHLRLLKVITVI